MSKYHKFGGRDGNVIKVDGTSAPFCVSVGEQLGALRLVCWEFTRADESDTKADMLDDKGFHIGTLTFSDMSERERFMSHVGE